MKLDFRAANRAALLAPIGPIAALALLLNGAALAAAGQEDARIRMFESSLLPAFSVKGEPEQRWTLSERMVHWKVPGMSIAVIRDGKIAWAKGYGVRQVGNPDKVDAQTVFSVGSMSKVGAAATTLRLVDAGKLSLDRDVNSYLTRWKLPKNMYTAIRPVTLRGILSHTAGLSVHGFKDFQPGEPLPGVIETLEGRAPAKTKPVLVEYVPGSKYQYSGGGTTLEELIIEEVTGLGFVQAARQYVFEPLGMARSTYENPLPLSHSNIAKAHGPDGAARALPRGYEAMPQMAASGLWTTPSDYARLIIAIIESHGKGNSFLSQPLARQMLTEVWPSGKGLGPDLTGVGLDRRFSHGGSNDSYKAWMEGHPNTGNGVVVLTNGSNGASLYAEVRRAVAVAEGWAPALSNHVRILHPTILPPAELEEMAGVYAQDMKDGMKCRVSYKDGSLYVSESTVSDGQRMVPIDDSARFVMFGGREPSYVRFVRNYDGRISGMLREEDTGIVNLDKIVSW